jgi:hypothetical protein
MAEPSRDDSPGGEEERIPVMQQVLDNPFLLLFLGVALPTVLYILWGVMEIATVPVSPLAK